MAGAGSDAARGASGVGPEILNSVISLRPFQSAALRGASLLSISWIMTILIRAAEISISFSKSVLILRLRLIQARVRSTIQHFGITSNPLAVSLRLT